jgi:hypothetical protein
MSFRNSFPANTASPRLPVTILGRLTRGRTAPSGQIKTSAGNDPQSHVANHQPSDLTVKTCRESVKLNLDEANGFIETTPTSCAAFLFPLLGGREKISGKGFQPASGFVASGQLSASGR